MPDPIFENVHPHEKPSLYWLADGDWVRFLGIVVWMLTSFLCIAFIIAAFISLVIYNNVGLAFVQAAIGLALKPPYGWRG